MGERGGRQRGGTTGPATWCDQMITWMSQYMGRWGDWQDWDHHMGGWNSHMGGSPDQSPRPTSMGGWGGQSPYPTSGSSRTGTNTMGGPGGGMMGR